MLNDQTQPDADPDDALFRECERACEVILQEVAQMELDVTRLLRDRTLAAARGEATRNLAALRREAEQLADIRELAEMERNLARSMRCPDPA